MDGWILLVLIKHLSQLLTFLLSCRIVRISSLMYAESSDSGSTHWTKTQTFSSELDNMWTDGQDSEDVASWSHRGAQWWLDADSTCHSSLYWNIKQYKTNPDPATITGERQQLTWCQPPSLEPSVSQEMMEDPNKFLQGVRFKKPSAIILTIHHRALRNPCVSKRGCWRDRTCYLYRNKNSIFHS